MRKFLPLALIALATPAFAAPKIDRGATAVTVTLDNGVVLTYAVKNDQLLGLNTATAGGVALKSPATVVRPILVQDKGDKPLAMDVFTFKDAKAEGESVRITCDLSETSPVDAFTRLFVTKDGKPFNDYYLFPHLGLPAEVMKLDTLAALAEKKPAGAPAGTLQIVITPVTENIAGWTWRGWKHHYEMALTDGRKLNCIREMSTWETQGQAAGNTLVAQRYRGLGGLAEKLEPMEAAKRVAGADPVKNAFTSTEILPGAVDKAPLVSPVVPGPQNISGREEAMKYRHGAWIAQMQRGGGANFVDYQYRPTVALASYYEKMDAIRTVSEVWPGDTQISYTDCLYFPLTGKQSTVDKVHLALLPAAPLAENESRTRYQEMDVFVRELVAKDLNLIISEPVPSLGFNWDSGWEWRINQLIQSVDSLKAAGVRRVMHHHPGWFNGRGLRQKETSFPIPQRMLKDPKKPDEPAKLANDTGGDCSIHDYIPQSPKVEALWKQANEKLNAAGIEQWGWITGMVYGTGPVVQKFGEKRFCKNDPAVDFSSGYPGNPARGDTGHRGIPFRDAEIRAWWEGRMNDARENLGQSGYWADSFQNMYMSQMNYQQPDWAPHVREWWEWIASESRKGAGFMSESCAFPALSCSVEVGDQKNGYRGEEWVLPYSTRWYRGQPVPFQGTARADEIFFRTMANKGPIAPGDGKPLQVPSYKRLSDEYMTALPRMNRSYQLADDKGVLWLTYAGDKEGVFFPFSDTETPANARAFVLGTNQLQADMPVEPQKTCKSLHTYIVQGDDLLAAFGFKRGDQKDPRIGRTYKAPPVFKKDWSKEAKP